MSDLVDIGSSLLNWIQNERVKSYNEGVDDMLKSVKEWARLIDIDPHGDNMPDLLNDILNQITQRHDDVGGSCK